MLVNYLAQYLAHSTCPIRLKLSEWHNLTEALSKPTCSMTKSLPNNEKMKKITVTTMVTGKMSQSR